LAFGLAVLTGAYALGPVSGAHFNPAVTIGVWAGGRFPGRRVLPYVVAQVIGAIVASSVLYLIASGGPDFDVAAGFAANGYGVHPPGGYPPGAPGVPEVGSTVMFLIGVRRARPRRASTG